MFRISPDGEKFSVVASGGRNTCGIAFDHGWNLFTSDNDHEGKPNDYVPGRVLHVTPGAYFAWPRGWMVEKTPWRADLLDSMHPDVGRYVPTGMAYYDDAYLPAVCRHGLSIAEWGRAKLLRYPLQARGASFKVEQADFFGDAEQATPPERAKVGRSPKVMAARPVGVAVGRGGRIFTTVCYMKGNEASPMYRSEIVMITRADDTANAPFDGYEETSATTDKLFAELANDSWQRRYRAHQELIRRGPGVADEAVKRIKAAPEGEALHTHLLWLVGSGGPTLIGAGSRLTVPYLVESVITPNKTVSPIFKWTMVTKKDGTAVAGLITSETGSELELMLPAGIRQTIPTKDIAKRELQDRSPMPEGLITTPEDLRDLLTYLAGLKEGK